MQMDAMGKIKLDAPVKEWKRRDEEEERGNRKNNTAQMPNENFPRHHTKTNGKLPVAN